jgi:N-acetylglucosamine kinase-like BadF-type ATPase
LKTRLVLGTGFLFLGNNILQLMMNPVYLFEAGGTKTTLLVYENGKTEEIVLPACNPNRSTEAFELLLRATIKIPSNAKVYFYGAGMGSEGNRALIHNVFMDMFEIEIEINTDILGAARAAFGDEEGFLAIMGTGGVGAYYDGTEIAIRRGGYGYLIDDYGGGLELGKILISAWLNDSFSEELNRDIEAYLHISKSRFIGDFYESKDLPKVSGLVRVLDRHQNNMEIIQILDDYFTEFFNRHVTALNREKEVEAITIIGGIGFNFQKVIGRVAAKFGISVLEFIDKPASRLLDYHLSVK